MKRSKVGLVFFRGGADIMKKSGSGGNRFGNDIYGVDELERFILSASFIMVLISVFIRS